MAYTDAGTAWTNALTAGYDKFLEYQLRSTPVFRQMVDKRPASVTNPGATITLSLVNEFSALATTPLTETSDITPVAPPNLTRVSVTLNEYGNGAVETLKLRTLSFVEVDPAVANVVGKNMVDTYDKLVQTVLDGATNIIGKNAGTIKTQTTSFAEASVAGTDVIDGTLVRNATALLRRRNAQARDARGMYMAVVHPDVANDLRGDSGWLNPHNYVDTANIYNAEIGAYMGVRFMESPRCTVVADGAASAKVYRTYVLGSQALVEANAIEPHVVIGPQVDSLRRFFPIGWYGLTGWSIYRQEPIEVIRSAATIAAL